MALVLLAMPVPLPGQPREIILATTTSFQDSGLLDVLVRDFERRSGYVVKPVAVGTGQALALGQRREADVLVVHAPEAERQFMAQGFGRRRRLVMHNDFVLVGPPSDPARIRNLRSVVEALRNIAGAGALFVSRGDHSGTHLLERGLWKRLGVTPAGRWYQQSGQGMGQTLNIAAEKEAYTLTDRGTYLALKRHLPLDILVEGDRLLLNLYHVIEVNAAGYPRVNSVGARAFADYLVSREAQEVIRTFGLDRYGQPLFFPDAGRGEDEPG